METFKKCKVESCKGNALNKNGIQIGKNFCSKHYKHIYRHGKILERTNRDPNEIIDCGEYYEIYLYNVKHEETGRTKIDKEDLGKVKKYKWCLNNKKYAITMINKKIIFLHQLILGYPPVGFEIDHRDTDPLNNRKYNLRIVTHQQNIMNRKVKGYYWHKINKKWITYIEIDGKRIHLGNFIDEQDAIKDRKKAEKKYFGEFAYVIKK